MSNFYAEIMNDAMLRFGGGVIDGFALRGLAKGGPIDINRFERMDKVRILLMYPAEQQEISEFVLNKLSSGHANFVGYNRMFRQELTSVDRIEVPATGISNGAKLATQYGDALKQYFEARHNEIDLAVVLHHGKPYFPDASPYFSSKILLASLGKPTQSIDTEKFRRSIATPGLPYYLANLSLAIYAKNGGKPWALDVGETSPSSDLILGVGGTRIEGRNQFAFTVLFEKDGTFDYWASDISRGEEEYVELLRHQINKVIDEHAHRHPEATVERISFHIAGKRPGALEKAAIQSVMKERSTEFRYALFHVNTTSLFWIADTNKEFWLPDEGLSVRLTHKDYLMVVEGYKPGSRPTRAPSRPLRVTVVDYTVTPEEMCSMLKEVYWLTRMNWKGFRAKKVPVSVYYPRLLAYMLCSLREHDIEGNLTKMMLGTTLRRKAWFL